MNFLLLNNKDFFNSKKIITVNNNNDIPNKDAILFIGSHTRSMNNPEHILKYFTPLKL